MNAQRNTLFQCSSARIFSSNHNLFTVALIALFATAIFFSTLSKIAQAESIPGEHEVSDVPNSTWKERWTTNIKEWNVTVFRERQDEHFQCHAFKQETSKTLMGFLFTNFEEDPPDGIGFEVGIAIDYNDGYSLLIEPSVIDNETFYTTTASTQFNGRPRIRVFAVTRQAGLRASLEYRHRRLRFFRG